MLFELDIKHAASTRDTRYAKEEASCASLHFIGLVAQSQRTIKSVGPQFSW